MKCTIGSILLLTSLPLIAAKDCFQGDLTFKNCIPSTEASPTTDELNAVLTGLVSGSCFATDGFEVWYNQPTDETCKDGADGIVWEARAKAWRVRDGCDIGKALAQPLWKTGWWLSGWINVDDVYCTPH